MARPLRITYPGAVYHLTSRGNEKKPIFKNDRDRSAFLDILAQVNNRYHWLCHACCLMENHYHLVIETPDGNLSSGMRQLNGVYTQFFNQHHKRTGHLFQGRYKAILIQKDNHLLEVCRYVVLNPVRAGMVDHPKEWKWSSYRATAGLGKQPSWLTTDWVFGQFGTRRERAEKEYRRFIRWGMDTEPIWEGVKGHLILGEDEFVAGLSAYLRNHKDLPEIPKGQRHVSRPGLDKLFPENLLRNRELRDKKIREAVEDYGYTQREVADRLGLHFSSVSRIINRLEKMSRK